MTSAAKFGCVGTLLVLLVCAPAAQAAGGPPDPAAPPGASGQWLPAEEWVMQRWTPFDESRLYAALHTTRDGVERWLADSRGRQTLVALADRRGVSRAELVGALVPREAARLPPSRYRLLRSRTNRVVTQSHLSQHMLFHTFHTWAVRDAARRTLGISAREWKRLRDRPRGDGPGATVAELARHRHVPVKRLRRPVIRAITKATRRGVHRRETPPAQAATALAEQRWKIEFWPLDRARKSGRAVRAVHLHCRL